MSGSCTATWYDGRTSQGHAVTVRLVEGSLAVSGAGVDSVYPLAEVCVDPPLGRVRRRLHFPDGASAETGADGFVEELLRRQGRGGVLLGVHRWEKSIGRAVVALALLVAIVFGFLRYLVPVLALKVAFALPPRTEELIGRETLQVLDQVIMRPSALPRLRREEVTRRFRAMTAGDPQRQGWRLEFRSSKEIGANAFALPSGIVVVTDRMVELAENDDDLAGVLAHEIGHLERRHALRHLLQNSVTALVVATLTGDLVSAGSLAATMPTALVDAKYSRDFEWEADAAAVRFLKRQGIPVRRYAEILARLEADHYQERKDVPRLGELFDDHPAMLERVQKVLAAQ
ncbi:M48 family metallopeptidase [Geomonas subterranea]|uniref:M48 family metallopeptidase n=1 Tax=Geomonas subterranea TaxID=2847989 RepID=A0ABX8LG37_9BACT|nr:MULTISPECIES: M48 family metallopeptidase [Geomonas]QXE90993.1 M48 family metallopeptidase [Geomonas subterranea]QXM10921.1 M48 family metallopeptidase [Geomonas subterranea]